MRYAVYHLPEGALGTWGAHWLGWDVRHGEASQHPEIANLPRPIDALSAVPRRYGFHATMKAPLRLAAGTDRHQMAVALKNICASHRPFAMQMRLHWDWGFLCLRPVAQSEALVALEADLVRKLDRFRAPLSPEDLARRNPERLSPPARAHLDRWGYPHVLDLFHYHLTLSGAITADEGEALAAALGADLAPLLAAPMPVGALALVEEGADKHFTLIEEIPLG